MQNALWRVQRDVSDFESVVEAFSAFQAEFAPVLGRKQWRERSQEYLQALLVQSQERCNAENLSEVVAASARVLQRFLSEARWEEEAVITRAKRGGRRKRLSLVLRRIWLDASTTRKRCGS